MRESLPGEDNPNDPSNAQPLIEHLTELRDRLIKSAWGVLAMTVVCWAFSSQLFDFIREPISPYLESGGLVFTHPIDKFMAHLKVSLLAGVILSCPFWVFQAWKFVSPGLYLHERRYGLMFISAGSILFLVGVSFAYFLVLPAAFNFLLHFGGAEDKPMITISEYLSFFISITLVFGLAFELPLVIVMLGAMGLVDQRFLREKRRYIIVGLAVIAAIVTPPDLMSMVMLLVPMWVLYEISIFLVGFFARRRQVASELSDS